MCFPSPFFLHPSSAFFFLSCPALHLRPATQSVGGQCTVKTVWIPVQEFQGFHSGDSGETVTVSQGPSSHARGLPLGDFTGLPRVKPALLAPRALSCSDPVPSSFSSWLGSVHRGLEVERAAGLLLPVPCGLWSDCGPSLCDHQSGEGA